MPQEDDEAAIEWDTLIKQSGNYDRAGYSNKHKKE